LVEPARARLHETLAWAEDRKLPHVVGAVHSELCNLAATEGDLETATVESDAALEIFRSLGDRWQVSVNLNQRTMIDATVGGDRLASARVRALEALDLAEMIRGPQELAFAVMASAYVLLVHGDEEHAAVLMRAATLAADLDESLVRMTRAVAPGVAQRLTALVERSRETDIELDGLTAVRWARTWILELTQPQSKWAESL
jgi:hypothetical protein